MHAEANAIISASRESMLGSTIYLVGIDMEKGGYVENGNCCSMCKRMILNAGIATVIIRDDSENFRVIDTKDWIDVMTVLQGISAINGMRFYEGSHWLSMP